MTEPGKDPKEELMRQILKTSREGKTKKQISEMFGLSHQQIREITAELTDKGYLRYSGAGHYYMTTDAGFKFLGVS